MIAAARKMSVHVRLLSGKNQMYIREGIAATRANVRMVGNVRMVLDAVEGLSAAACVVTVGLCVLVLGCRERCNPSRETLLVNGVFLKRFEFDLVKEAVIELCRCLKPPIWLYLWHLETEKVFPRFDIFVITARL